MWPDVVLSVMQVLNLFEVTDLFMHPTASDEPYSLATTVCKASTSPPDPSLQILSCSCCSFADRDPRAYT